MAGFFIPFGRGVKDATDAISEGHLEQQQEQANKVQLQLGQQGVATGAYEAQLRQMLLDKVKSGELPMAALYDTSGYFKNITADDYTRKLNVQYGQQMLQDADNLIDRSDPKHPMITDKAKYDAYRASAYDFLGPNGQGTLMQPGEVFKIHGLANASDAMMLYQTLRNQNLMNPKPVPYVTMGAGGESEVSGLSSHLDPNTGERTMTATPLGPPGTTTPLGGGGPAAGAPAPGGVTTPEGTPWTPPGTYAPGTVPVGPPPFSGPPPAGVTGPPGAAGIPFESSARAYASGAPASAPLPGVTKVSWPVPPDKMKLTDPPPQPVPNAWGGTPYPRAHLAPKLGTQDAAALSSLNGVLHQSELLYRILRSIPPSVRRGAPGAVIDWLKMHAGISSGETIDGLMSQIGAAKASLIAGFQSAGKTRAFAAIKMVQDHYPQLYDSDELILHKLEQLLRPDGYLSFAKNAILYGPSASVPGASINEPLVAPPGAVYDSSRVWHDRNGKVGMMLDGIPYRRDPDGYWVQVIPRGGSR